MKDTHIQMINGDILNLDAKDWRDGDVIFINCTCFNDELMAKLAEHAKGLKKG